MDKISYNSYPESAESSPRSREIEFDNPTPWEDQQQQHSYKVKLMCSYGGKIQPRPHDNQLAYVNGDTKIISVDRSVRFSALVSKLLAVCGCGDCGESSLKYQLPGEDLDALISVTNDDDLEHMMHEYDRLLRLSSKPARMRLFLFSSSPISGGFGSYYSTKSDREALNQITSLPESEKSITDPFGSEKVAPIPPLQSAVMLPQQNQELVVLEQPVFTNQQVIQPDHGRNSAEIQRQIHEFQRIQIIDQDQQQQQMQHQHQLQQQEGKYRRKSDEGFMETGRYFTPTYPQNPGPTTVSQTNPQPPIGYWQGNNIYTATSQNLPQQQVYMIPVQSQAPGTLYHSVMRPTSQGNQGYYQHVQQINQHHPDASVEQQNKPGYNMVQPQTPYSSGTQVMSSGGPMGLQQTTPYSQMGNQVYYTVAGEGMMMQPQPPQPQYQGMGQPVSGMTDLRTGPDGKVVVNTAPKVSQTSDAVSGVI